MLEELIAILLDHSSKSIQFFEDSIIQARQWEPQQNMYKKLETTATHNLQKAISAQFIGDTATCWMKIQWYDNIRLKKCRGASSQPLKTMVQQSLEGLAAIYIQMEKPQKWWSCRVAAATQNWNEWRWLNKMSNLKQTSSNGSPECNADPSTEDLTLQDSGANPHCRYTLK